MDDIYMLADTIIFNRIGGNLKAARLKLNITQQSLADAADISLSSLKKIEKGEIGSFNSLLRVLRTLGKLNVFQPLVKEEQLVRANTMNSYIQSRQNINEKEHPECISQVEKSSPNTTKITLWKILRKQMV